MSEVLLAGAGAGAGVGSGAWVCTGGRGWGRLRLFFFGLTGAAAGRAANGEIPPLGPVWARVPGVVPPVLPVEPDDGTTPPVAAEALAAPHANATRSTTIANAERSRFPPCMGVGI